MDEPKVQEIQIMEPHNPALKFKRFSKLEQFEFKLDFLGEI